MGNSDSKEEIIIKCSLEEMVKHFFKDYMVVWHDPNVNSLENQQHITQLKQFCEVLTFAEWEKALAAIQDSKAACHVITSGTNGEVLVEEIYESSNVAKIYVFCMNKEYHSSWAKKYQKVSCVETNIQTLINQIKQNLLEWYREISSIKVNLPSFAPIFNDIHKSQMNNLHRYLKVIPNFTNRLQAKTDFLNLSKLIYTDLHNTNLIAEFEKSYNEYNKTQVLKWYTKESFLYKVTNNCLRIASSDSIQYCRLLLKDVEQAIKDQYEAKSKNFNGLLYRGAYLSQEEWSSLKENQDKEIEMHGFLSVSKEKNVALNFMRLDPSKKVLITIIVPKGPQEEEQGFAEIEEFSLLPQEKEILFNVRSRFTVLEAEEEYSQELPYRHLVLLYGAQGLRKLIAEQNPVIKVPIPSIQDISCCQCTQGSPENFLFRSLEKEIYYCKNCLEKSDTAAAFLCVPLKHTPTATERDVKGCLLMNSASLKIPFYGYKCSQCQAKKQKRYFICTDCCKLTWCENCFSETLTCIQAQHTILIETRPFTFWCEKMSESELSHLEFHNDFVSDNDPIFLQAEMYYESHNYDKAIEYYSLYIQRSQTKIIDTKRGAAFRRLGDVYFEKKEYEKMLEYDLKSLEFNKSLLLGIGHPGLAAAYGNVGSTYKHLKEYSKALEYHSKALNISKSLRREEDVATAYCSIGAVYTCQGEYHQALEHYFKALAISESAKKKNHAYIASCYGDIGTVYSHQKEDKKALEYHLKCLNIEKSLYGENHPQVAVSYSNLALVFSNQGEHTKAVEYYLKCLKIGKSLYGENHPQVAASYSNIASVLFSQNECAKAIEYDLKSLDIKKTLYGENHPEVATSYKEIASVFFDQKEYNKALEYQLKALGIEKLLHGEKHPQIAESYGQIGIVYNKQKEYTKALEFHLTSLDIRKSPYGENHPQVAASYSNIASVFSNQKEYNKALEYDWKALDIRKALNGENHADVARSYHSIGHVYLEQKENTKALEYHFKSLEIRKSLFEENSQEIALCYSHIGKALNEQGEYRKAEEFLLKAINIQKIVFGEKSSQIAASYSKIVDVYMNQKEHNKALEYCLKCLEIEKSVYVQDHPDTIKTQNRALEIQSLCL